MTNMKNYFYLQFKRVLKVLPFVLIACILLSVGLGLMLGGMIESDEKDEKNQKFKISIVGSTEDSYLNLGVKALETLDSTRFAIEIEQTDENTAKRDLENGKIAAYVVIPDGFVDAASRGEIMKIKYYTTDSAVGVVSIFKDEVTKTISDILMDSQKGVYGLAEAIEDNSVEIDTVEQMNNLSLDYVALILKRSQVYTVEVMGVSDGLSTSGYFFCGILTLFTLLMGIVAAPVFIKRESSLGKVIWAKGGSASGQIFSEYLAYFLLIFIIFSLIISASVIFLVPRGIISDISWIATEDILGLLILLIPSIVVITSMQFLLFEISSSLIGGVLLQFLVSVALGYISGCFYPIYYFPERVQKLSAFLPSGIARSYISGCLTDNVQKNLIIFCALYFVLFTVLTIIVRRLKITGRAGD